METAHGLEVVGGRLFEVCGAMTKGQKIMRWEQRIRLEEKLRYKVPIAQIARELGFSRQTISAILQTLQLRQHRTNRVRRGKRCGRMGIWINR